MRIALVGAYDDLVVADGLLALHLPALLAALGHVQSGVGSTAASALCAGVGASARADRLRSHAMHDR